MIADRGKKSKVADEQDSEHIDAELVLSIEKLQEVQDQLDKVSLFAFEFFNYAPLWPWISDCSSPNCYLYVFMYTYLHE